MKSNKGIIILIVGFAVLAAGLLGLSVFSLQRSNKEFISDGYILDASVKENTEAISDTCEQVYFASGAKYKEKFGKLISFKNSSNDKVEMAPEQFIHYSDESMGSFTKGVIMDLKALEEDQYGYYSVTKNTILLKNGTSYEMTSRGEKITMPEFVWKISDIDYTIVSPTITLNLGNDYEVVLDGYAQIKYIDNGIVRIVHQQGTYQTVSADSYLETADGAILNLAGKNFYVEDKPVLSLDSIALNDSNYLNVDENIDAPTIPTFNVVNGADGQNGIDGEMGLDGEQGATGEDGFEGAAGAQGVQGAAGAAGTNGENGASGKAGNDGSDGVEGDLGDMGKDGKNGDNGYDAESANDIKVENKAQPEITMDSKPENYKVSAGSASMQLSMTDEDGSIMYPEGSEYPFTVKMYNKQTMEEIAIPNAANIQTTLLNGGTVVLNVDNLSADTEYLLQVVGSYEVEDGQVREVVFYNKTFRTDALGITLAKKEVTDHSFDLDVDVSNSDIQTYGLVVYTGHDASGQPDLPEDLTTYSMKYNWKKEMGDVDGYHFEKGTPQGTDQIKSNTQYYAHINGVTDIGGSIKLEYSMTEIAFKTLKEKPYNLDEDGTTKHAIEEIAPLIAANTKTSTIEVTMPELKDNDRGITGYRYELYKQGTDGDVVEEPSYVIETDIGGTQTFQLNSTDSTFYAAKVIVVFDDNEKTAEYSTLYSVFDRLTGEVFPTVKWEPIDIQHEKIDGWFEINDPSNMVVLNQDCPLTLTMTGPHDETYQIVYKPSENNYFEDNGIPHTIRFRFNLDGLETNTPYSFNIVGAVDLNNNGEISTSERTVNIGSLLQRTTENKTKKLAIVGKTDTSETGPFTAHISFTTAQLSGDTTTKEDREYQAEVLDKIVFELIRVTGTEANPVYTTIGEYSMRDRYVGDNGQPVNHESDYHTKYWIDSSNVYKNPTGKLEYNNPDAVTSSLTLTAGMFGLEDNASELHDGNYYILRVKKDEATGEIYGFDYTATPDTEGMTPDEKDELDKNSIIYHNNKIYFADGQSEIRFEIKKQHLPTDKPNDQVQVIQITKSQYQGGNPDIENSTTVALQIKAKYGYSDADEITYYVYEVLPEKSSKVGYLTNLYPEMFKDSNDAIKNGYVAYPNPSIYPEGNNGYALNKYAYIANSEGENTEVVAKLVAHATVENLGHQTGNIGNVRLVFDGAKFENRGTHGNLQKANATDPNVWTLDEAGYVFERGKQYFVAYTVKADPTDIDCDGLKKQDIYPFCSYGSDGNAKVPYYRSSVVTVDKQIPKVERYLDSTSNKNSTWMYRITDPDYALIDPANAVVNGVKNTQFNMLWEKGNKAAVDTSLSFNADTPLTFNSWKTDDLFDVKSYDLPRDTNGNKPFVSHTVGGMDNNNYYKSSYKYWLNAVDGPETVESVPYLHIRSGNGDSNAGRRSAIVTSGTTGANISDTSNYANTVVVWGEPINRLADGTVQYDPAVKDDAGYRYRITLRGGIDTLERIAAIRVTFTGLNASDKPFNDSKGNPVVAVYDPVYIKVQPNPINTDAGHQGYAELNGIAYADVDTGGLQQMINNGAVNASIKVEAYYANGVAGMSTFAANPDAFITEVDEDGFPTGETEDVVKKALSFESEVTGSATATIRPTNLFALREVQSNGNSGYSELRNKNLRGIYSEFDRYVYSKSLFVPGSVDTGSSGFNPYSAYFSGRYASSPMILTQGTESCLEAFRKDVTFDESGMKIGGYYYIPEKLDITEIKFVETQYQKVNLNDIMPAVQLLNGDQAQCYGATSLTPLFEAKGTGAHAGMRICMSIRESNMDPQNPQYKELNYTYNADKSTASKTVFDIAKGENKYKTEENKAAYPYDYIRVDYDAETDKFYLPMSIRGLKKGTTYEVNLFAMLLDENGDPTGEYKDLYCITGKDTGVVGYNYEFTTLKEVVTKIDDANPKYEYNSYDVNSASDGGTGKKRMFTFNVEGDDGVGKIAYYRLVTSGGTPVTGWEKLPYAGKIDYYSQDPNDNVKIDYTFNPSEGSQLRAGGSYKVELMLVEQSSETDTVEKFTAIANNPAELEAVLAGSFEHPFTVQGQLEDPGFNVSKNYSLNADGKYDASITVISGNPEFSIEDDEYRIYVFPNSRDKNDSDVPIIVKLNKGEAKQTNKITIAGGDSGRPPLEPGETYTVLIEANVDKDNRKSTENTVLQRQISIETSTSATCDVDIKATKSELKIEFTGLSNFEKVDQILCTVYKKGDATEYFSETVDISTLEGYNGGDFTNLILYRNGLNMSGDLQVQIQYLGKPDESGFRKMLGDKIYYTTVISGGLTAMLNNLTQTTKSEEPQEELPKAETPALGQVAVPAAGIEKQLSAEEVKSQLNTEIGAAGIMEQEVVVEKSAAASEVEPVSTKEVKEEPKASEAPGEIYEETKQETADVPASEEQTAASSENNETSEEAKEEVTNTSNE